MGQSAGAETQFYCVRCQESHEQPVAVAINDPCSRSAMSLGHSVRADPFENARASAVPGAALEALIVATLEREGFPLEYDPHVGYFVITLPGDPPLGFELRLPERKR